MIAVAAAFVALWLWERPNLAAWSRPERTAFWALWGLGLAWALAVQAHLPIPTLYDLTLPLRPLWTEWLTPRRDIFW